MQTDACAAGVGCCCSGLRAVFDQRRFFEHYGRSARCLVSIAAKQRVTIPVIDPQQTIITDALEHEVAALVVTDAHKARFQPRAQLGAQTARDQTAITAAIAAGAQRRACVGIAAGENIRDSRTGPRGAAIAASWAPRMSALWGVGILYVTVTYGESAMQYYTGPSEAASTVAVGAS